MSRMTYQPGMDPHPRRTDCPATCDGRGLDRYGHRYACAHNGFVGLRLHEIRGPEGVSGKRWTEAELTKGGREIRANSKTWKAPRLSAEGKPFEPERGEVGSWVRWTTNGVECVGQVFAKAPRPRHVWVATEAQHVEAIDLAFLTSL